jgi:ketosteroid isomerase-like protein
MYHPSIWHPIQPLDMAAAFRSMHQTTSSPNSIQTSPEKNSFSAAVAAFNAANGAFSVNTLLNQTSPDHLRFPPTQPSLSAAAAVHQHHLFSTLFHHYPYTAAFRPLLNTGTTTGLLTSSTNSNSSLSSSSSSESSAFVPAGKKFKSNAHDENHCDISPSEKSSDESFSKYSGI